MNLQNPKVVAALNQMQDIVTPPPVSWWPLSYGVWAIIIGVLGVLTGVTWYLWVRHKNNRYRQEAQNLLHMALKEANSNQQKIIATNQLLKQVAMTHYGRQTVAHLMGKEWVQFLQTNALYLDLPESFLQSLHQIYTHQEPNDIETQAFIEFAQAWIKGHHK